MGEIEQAIARIGDIRAQLAGQRRFRGYAPESVALLGLASLAVTLLQVFWPERFAPDDATIVRSWAMVMTGGFIGICVEATARTIHAGDMAKASLAAALRVVLPATVMAAALPVAVLRFAPTASWIIPGFWHLLIGMVAFASYPQMPRRIVWPAGWYLATGTAGLLLAGSRGSLSPLLVGAPFIVGHFAIAWTLLEKERPARAR